MKSVCALMLFIFISCFNSSYAYTVSENNLCYSSAVSLKNELSSIKRQIYRNERQINSYKYSNSLSQYEKQRRIKRLQNENYRLQQKSNQIKRDYRRAIS